MLHISENTKKEIIDRLNDPLPTRFGKLRHGYTSNTSYTNVITSCYTIYASIGLIFIVFYGLWYAGISSNHINVVKYLDYMDKSYSNGVLTFNISAEQLKEIIPSSRSALIVAWVGVILCIIGILITCGVLIAKSTTNIYYMHTTYSYSQLNKAGLLPKTFKKANFWRALQEIGIAAIICVGIYALTSRTILDPDTSKKYIIKELDAEFSSNIIYGPYTVEVTMANTNEIGKTPKPLYSITFSSRHILNHWTTNENLLQEIPKVFQYNGNTFYLYKTYIDELDENDNTIVKTEFISDNCNVVYVSDIALADAIQLSKTDTD